VLATWIIRSNLEATRPSRTYPSTLHARLRWAKRWRCLAIRTRRAASSCPDRRYTAASWS